MYRILAVEDDPFVQTVLRKTLLQEGYECRIAGTLAAGLEAARKEKPDLILMDIYLPDGNGVDMCRTIKADPALRIVPILLMSGVAISVEERVQGLEAGADDYVLKPFTTQELVVRMKSVLKDSVKPPHA